MKLTSTAFDNEGTIPSKYTCDGENIIPPLSIEEVPPLAQSLVLIMDDPDVPSFVREDNMWDHWLVFNIPPTVNNIPEGQQPKGTPGCGTGGNDDYMGPCPPDREHRYFFKLYALDCELTLSAGISKTELEQAMDGHIIEKTELMGRYQREG